jgi:2-(1,2-epoxy-1,2-dihydrophenyl)acetyl-CoA isomerase
VPRCKCGGAIPSPGRMVKMRMSRLTQPPGSVPPTTTVRSMISVEQYGHIAQVEIHRPPHNFFDLEVLTELADTFEQLPRHWDCRVAVLCSEGKNFCAGADLTNDVTLDNTTRLYAIAARLVESPIPIVAAVQGAAVGGGLGLTLIADFRVSTPETRFSCNFAKLGIHHGFGITVTLPEVVGMQRAMEMLYTGRDLSGDEAFMLGLTDRLTAPADLLSTARELAGHIATSAPLAVASIRQTMRGALGVRIRNATRREAEQQAILRASADFREGVRAMAERRAPRFTGH